MNLRDYYLRLVMQEEFMQRCLELAERGKDYAAPNPLVGSVLVYEDRIIGEGWHERYGEKHAEVNCIDSVPEADRALIPQSTLFVNLEPCAHQGKQPPCALRIIKEGIKRVVIANEDTYSEVNGKGIALLRENGIEVITGILETAGRWLNRRFFTRQEQQRPYIILKWAQSKEGNMAPANYERTQLSNEQSQHMNHQWRAEEDAILVGYRTALHDDPQLTARLYPGKQPLRIVLDRELALSATHHLLADLEKTLIVNSIKGDTVGSKQWLKLEGNALLHGLINFLCDQNISSVIIEGGAHTINSFVALGLWDEARVFETPVSIPDGIASPVLTNFSTADSWELSDDVLKLYTNNSFGFVYPKGMKL